MNKDVAKYLFPNYGRNEDEAKYLVLNYLRNEDEAKYSFLNYLRNKDEAKYSFLNYRLFVIASVDKSKFSTGFCFQKSPGAAQAPVA